MTGRDDVAAARQAVGDVLQEALNLLRDALDSDECSFDHHGYCQAHYDFSEDACYQQRIKTFLAKHAPAEGKERSDP